MTGPDRDLVEIGPEDPCTSAPSTPIVMVRRVKWPQVVFPTGSELNTL
jgi:hypothetical protein